MDLEGGALISTANKLVFALSHNLVYVSLPPVGVSPSWTDIHCPLERLGALWTTSSQVPMLQNDFHLLYSLCKPSNNSQLGTDKKQASQATAHGSTSDFPPETSQRISHVERKKTLFLFLLKRYMFLGRNIEKYKKS